MRGRHEAQRCAVFDAQAFTIEAIRQQSVGGQHDCERQARAISVLSTKHDQFSAGLRPRPRQHDPLVELRKADTASGQTLYRP